MTVNSVSARSFCHITRIKGSWAFLTWETLAMKHPSPSHHFLCLKNSTSTSRTSVLGPILSLDWCCVYHRVCDDSVSLDWVKVGDWSRSRPQTWSWCCSWLSFWLSPWPRSSWHCSKGLLVAVLTIYLRILSTINGVGVQCSQTVYTTKATP